jgi:uncharacterized protein (DUF1810 family)
MNDEPHGLQRFVDAQERSDTYQRALEELRAGQKTWISLAIGRLPAGRPQRG